jgi:hypothetical protein
VLLINPVKPLSTVPVALKVADPKGARSTVALMSPTPLAESQAEPAEAEQVHAMPVRGAGKESVTNALLTVSVELLLVTVIV